MLEGAEGKIQVLVDGGIRRGTDVFKALALGATAVGIGRPEAWGLAAFGQPGVEAVLKILRRELQTIMRQGSSLGVSFGLSYLHFSRSLIATAPAATNEIHLCV